MILKRSVERPGVCSWEYGWRNKPEIFSIKNHPYKARLKPHLRGVTLEPGLQPRQKMDFANLNFPYLAFQVHFSGSLFRLNGTTQHFYVIRFIPCGLCVHCMSNGMYAIRTFFSDTWTLSDNIILNHVSSYLFICIFT